MRRMNAETHHQVRLRLNGHDVIGLAEPRMLLSDFLRHALGKTGTHVGCEHGVCGACTVRIDGAMARSCLTLAVQVHDSAVDTVESLEAAPGQLSILQSAFKRHFALQCGFCTPGILMSLDTLLVQEPGADEARIRDVLSGHLCRCTGYEPILKAALFAAAELRKDQNHA